MVTPKGTTVILNSTSYQVVTYHLRIKLNKSSLQVTPVRKFCIWGEQVMVVVVVIQTSLHIFLHNSPQTFAGTLIHSEYFRINLLHILCQNFGFRDTQSQFEEPRTKVTCLRNLNSCSKLQKIRTGLPQFRNNTWS